MSDAEKGARLIEETNQRLPQSSLMVANALAPMVTSEVGPKLWHITAIGETAPGREWLLEKYAITVIKEIDEHAEKSILVHEPIARNADSDAERRFARTIQNARKKTIKRTPKRTRKSLPKKIKTD